MSTDDLPSPSWAKSTPVKPVRAKAEKTSPQVSQADRAGERPSKGSPGARICAALAILFFLLAALVGMTSQRLELAIYGIFSALLFVVAAIHFYELRQQRVQAWDSHQILEEIARNTRRS